MYVKVQDSTLHTCRYVCRLTLHLPLLNPTDTSWGRIWPCTSCSEAHQYGTDTRNYCFHLPDSEGPAAFPRFMLVQQTVYVRMCTFRYVLCYCSLQTFNGSVTMHTFPKCPKFHVDQGTDLHLTTYVCTRIMLWFSVCLFACSLYKLATPWGSL